MGKLKQIQSLVRNGLYYFTEHAYDEAEMDGFGIYDIEQGILTEKIRRSWAKQGKYEVIGWSSEGRQIVAVCRITLTGKVRVITVYEDKPRG